MGACWRWADISKRCGATDPAPTPKNALSGAARRSSQTHPQGTAIPPDCSPPVAGQRAQNGRHPAPPELRATSRHVRLSARRRAHTLGDTGDPPASRYHPDPITSLDALAVKLRQACCDPWRVSRADPAAAGRSAAHKRVASGGVPTLHRAAFLQDGRGPARRSTRSALARSAQGLPPAERSWMRIPRTGRTWRSF